MKILTSVILILLSLTLCSWASQGTERKRKVETETREVGFFNKINSSGPVQLILQKGETNKVTVEAESNIIEYVITEVEGDKLIVRMTGSWNNEKIKQPILVHVTLPELREIKAKAASSVESKEVWESPELKLDASSAARISLAVKTRNLELEVVSAASIIISGETVELEAELTAAGTLKAGELVAERADVKISSTAYAVINVQNELSYDVSAIGKLKYYGSPEITNSKADFLSKVIHIKD